MQIDAIVSDLDDTLLNPSSKLSPYTVQVLRQAAARGVRVIPASGRAAYSMRPFVEELGTGLPYIACNGAQLIGTDHQPFENHFLSPEQGRALIRYLRERGQYMQCYRDAHFYYEQACGASERYQRSTGMQGIAVGDLEAFLDFPTPKILCVAEPVVVAELYPAIQAAFPELGFTISKPYFLEAQPRDINKGTALRTLAAQLGLTPERTLVFGDSLNDVEMLQYAVHSVAMGNARDEVKRAVRHVCATNAEDGVARFVQAHVLDGLPLNEGGDGQ
ncbi:MAG: Cof-type HAD-IIB family hydrolase [Candidatus Limiplasma sp.]|nr:Cof-type HAD-IIB family hydrolase [Candidatus Limiplasma sp.]